MADNVAITAGSGTNIATDEVSGTLEHIQLFKLAISTDGSRTLVPADATNGIDVDVTRVSGQVQIGDGTTAVIVDATGGDAESASTASLVTSGRMKLFNGTTWDRVRGDITNGIDVDVTRVKPDGTNTMPSLDVAARRGYVQVTDGTNSLPTMDAAARAGFVKVTDGTNVVGIDTVHNDNESATENHLMVGARNSGLNHLGTFDNTRASVGVAKTATYVAAQTGTALWTPAAGKAVCISYIQIQSYGTTAGTCIVWFGGSADTTYTRGTDFAVFDGEFAPSATNKPGFAQNFATHLRGAADFVLRVTTTNAQSVTINVWGYEI